MITINEIIEKLIFFKENMDKMEDGEIFEDPENWEVYLQNEIIDKIDKQADKPIYYYIYFDLYRPLAEEEEVFPEDMEEFFPAVYKKIDEIIDFLKKL